MASLAALILVLAGGIVFGGLLNIIQLSKMSAKICPFS